MNKERCELCIFLNVNGNNGKNCTCKINNKIIPDISELPSFCPNQNFLFINDLILTIRDKSLVCSSKPYKYLITVRSTPNTAFKTREGLRKWMSDRKLKIGKKIDKGIYFLSGKYNEVSLWSKSVFNKMSEKMEHSFILNNGYYTKALVYNNIVFYLNCNVKQDHFSFCEHDGRLSW